MIGRTEGNPFFLEESVRTLVETQVLVGDRGAYRIAKAPQAWEIPATAQAILAARIDRLPPEDKRLLQAASVIGKDVPFALLQTIADSSEDDLRRALGHLQAAEFLYEASIFPDLEYTFKHALTHEVAYGSVLQDRRRRLHARIVEAIEALYPERLAEHVERLALHASRAQAWEQAIAYGRQAGLKAHARCSYAQAAKYLEEALDAVSRLSDDVRRSEAAFDVRYELASALSPLGDHPRCLALIDEALDLAHGLGDRRRIAVAASRKGNVLCLTGDPAGGLPFARDALRAAEGLDDPLLRVRLDWYLGLALQLLGDFPRAIDAFRDAVALLPGDLLRQHPGGPGQPPGLTAQSWLAFCLAEQGAFDEALELGEQASAAAEALGLAYSIGMAAWGYAYATMLRGELSKAVTVSDRVAAICAHAGIPQLVTSWSASLGYARVLSGDVVEGVSTLQYSRDTIANNRYMEAQFLAWLAHGQALAGRFPEALASVHTALDLAQRGSQRGQEAWALRILGEVALLATPGDANLAADYFRKAADLGTELRMRPTVAHCHLGLGRLYRQTGKSDQAQEHLTIATTMYREMDMRFYLDQAEAEMSNSP